MKNEHTTAALPESSESTSRIEAFSDGIFGVAITLLALEVGVEEREHMTNALLLDSILALWPKYFAYFNSFATVLLMWLVHHKLFQCVRKTSSALILANGLLLTVVALVPFPTKTVGEFISTPGKNVAVEFYTGYFLLINFAFMLLWSVASSKHKSLLYPSVTNQMAASVMKSYQTGVLINLICFGLSFIEPWLGIAANMASWIYWAVADKE